MKERPIIFSTDMVRTILEGRTTQTRRVIKNKYGICDKCWERSVPHNADASIFVDAEKRPIIYLKVIYCEHNDVTGGRISCPYGQVGDRLWVRETWNLIETVISPQPIPDKVIYKASPETYSQYPGIHWRPSPFMPRWASRTLLEITEIRVERLQEITEEDAVKEGCKSIHTLPGGKVYASYDFRILWDSLNAKRGYGWEKNPWVWVISFNLVGVRLK